MEFNEIVDGYVKASKRYYEKKQKLENTISKAEEKLRALKDKAPSWIKNLLIPLAKEIKKRLNMKAYEIYGPFGVTCETHIYFSNYGKDGDIKITKVNALRLSIYPSLKNDEFDLVCEDMTTPLPRNVDEIIKLLKSNGR